MSGKVSSLSIRDSGRYYTLSPRVVIDAPRFDSGSFAAIDSQDFKFGCGSLLHDSSSASTFGTLTDSHGKDKFVMQSFWIKLDSNAGTSTILWSDDYRLFIDSDLKVNFAYRVPASQKDAFQPNNLQLRTVPNKTLTKHYWHFVKLETFNSGLRINIDSSYYPFPAVWTMGLIDSNYFYDSGDVINCGLHTGEIAPHPFLNKNGQYVDDSNIDRSFSGRLDNYHFTVDSTKTLFDASWSSWIPDSAGETYENETPIISHNFDYRRAKASAYIDSSLGKVNRLVITDSGCGYDSAPGVTLIGGNTARDSNYRLGDIVEQTFSSGIKIQGEVQWYTKDSALDSARYLSLAHVGADDGKYHTFIGGAQLINKTLNFNTGLDVISVEEQNKMSENEQNDVFSQTFVDDFLDFTENNPFGDPENN